MYSKIDAEIQHGKSNYKIVKINASFFKPYVTVDVDGDVILYNMHISKIPACIRFGKVTGDFIISSNDLETMEGLPVEVGGVLNIMKNKIKSFDGSTVKSCMALEGQPQKVKTDYPLTDENYKLFLQGELSENVVFVGDEKMRGILTNINERENIASVQLSENVTVRCSLDKVYPMHASALAKAILS